MNILCPLRQIDLGFFTWTQSPSQQVSFARLVQSLQWIRFWNIRFTICLRFTMSSLMISLRKMTLTSLRLTWTEEKNEDGLIFSFCERGLGSTLDRSVEHLSSYPGLSGAQNLIDSWIFDLAFYGPDRIGLRYPLTRNFAPKDTIVQSWSASPARKI